MAVKFLWEWVQMLANIWWIWLHKRFSCREIL
jgi:hypothetical protein